LEAVGGGWTTDGLNGLDGIGRGGNGSNSSPIPGITNTGGGAGAPSQPGGSGIVILTCIPFYSVDAVRDNAGGGASGYMSELSLCKDNNQVSNNGITVSKLGGGGIDGALTFLFDNNLNSKFGTAVPHEILFTYPNTITMEQPTITMNETLSLGGFLIHLMVSILYYLIPSSIFQQPQIGIHISLCNKYKRCCYRKYI
jgi:hypothetical protein